MNSLDANVLANYNACPVCGAARLVENADPDVRAMSFVWVRSILERADAIERGVEL